MRDFRNNRNTGGGRDFKRRDFDRPQEMHSAICSNCGKECEVPFRPSGNKPVFCRECFQNNRTSSPVRSDNFQRRPNFGGREEQVARAVEQPQYGQQFEALNIKLDKILDLLTAKDVVKEVEINELVSKPVPAKRKKVVKVSL